MRLARPSSASSLARPLAVVDPGLVLSVGATAAIIVLAARAGTARGRQRVAAHGAGRGGGVAGDRTGAVAGVGDLLQPRDRRRVCCSTWRPCRLMAVVQVAASLTVLAHPVAPAAASAFGLVTAWAAGGLAASANLVEWLPWLALRMPAPAFWVAASYLLGLAGSSSGRTCARCPVVGRAHSGGAVSAVADGVRDLDRGGALHVALAVARRWAAARRRRSTSGRATRRWWSFPTAPAGLSMLAACQESVTFDIGERVVAPSLWARGTGRLDALVLTHGDPDHIGGATAVVDDFAPPIFDGGARARPRATADVAGPRAQPAVARGGNSSAASGGRSAAPTCACGTRRRPTGNVSACATTTRS